MTRTTPENDDLIDKKTWGPNREHCGSCYFMGQQEYDDESGYLVGWCFRHPPPSKSVDTKMSRDPACQGVSVGVNEWCGEFRPHPRVIKRD